FQAEYQDAIAQICTLDSQDQAGLRSKYLPLLVGKQRSNIQEVMKRQDWDGTILKIDRIISDLQLTGPLAAEIWVERARAHVKLSQWDEAEKDYAKAVELKPGDADLRAERGQFYEKRGQLEKTAAEFNAAVASAAKAVATVRATWVEAPHLDANR